jgi:arginine utilization protein RocB
MLPNGKSEKMLILFCQSLLYYPMNFLKEISREDTNILAVTPQVKHNRHDKTG